MDKKIQKAETQELGYLQEEDTEMMGTDDIGKEDLIIPRLKIVQALTKQKHGVEDGNYINHITGKNYGKKIIFIPMVHWKSNIKFTKDDGLVCRSFDGIVNTKGEACKQCGQYFFGKDGSKPPCMRTYNYFIAIRNELEEAIKNKTILPPLCLVFASAATKTGKLINTNIKVNAGRKFPIYAQSYELTVPDSPREFSNVGSAFIPEVRVAEFVTKEEKDYLRSMFVELSKVKIDIAAAMDVEEETGTSESDDI